MVSAVASDVGKSLARLGPRHGSALGSAPLGFVCVYAYAYVHVTVLCMCLCIYIHVCGVGSVYCFVSLVDQQPANRGL